MQTELIVAIIGIVAAVFGGQGFWTWLISKKSGKTNESKLLMGIAYSKIIDQCNHYIKRGWIDADEYHELYHYLYQPYEDMGGNGTAERLMGIVKGLPAEGGNHDKQSI